MKTRKASSGEDVGLRPALSPEARENQMISLAVDLVEKRLREGTASSAETTYYLRLSGSKARLEKRSWKKKTNCCGQRPRRCRRQRTLRKCTPKQLKQWESTVVRTKRITAMIGLDKICFWLMAAMPWIMLACLFTDRERPTSKRYWWYLPPSILSLLTAIAVGLPQIIDKWFGGFGCWCTLILHLYALTMTKWKAIRTCIVS